MMIAEIWIVSNPLNLECMLLAEHSVIMLQFKIIANNWVYFQLINIIKKKVGRVDFSYLIDS